MSVTIKDVARETGLASGTISKYLNGGSVRPENRRCIEEIWEKVKKFPSKVFVHAGMTHTFGGKTCLVLKEEKAFFNEI